MRVPIWSFGSNPSVDPRICKQSLSCTEDQVLEGWLKWLDPTNKALGCIGTRRLHPKEHESREHKQAAGTMRAAWGMKQSGYAGPLVFQMRKQAGSAEGRPNGG